MTAILIHGCHLEARNWDDIMWGNPRAGRLGRVPKGILEAQKHGADTIIFSTGASHRNGVKEGEVIYQETLARRDELTGLTGMWRWQLNRWLGKRHVLELTSQNTREEVLASARIARDRGARRLILVSSPTHVLRCHQAAISVLNSDSQLRHFLDNLYAVASDTSFADSTVDDVVIVEPPHRGDMPNVPIHKTLGGIFPLMRREDVAVAFNEELRQLIEKHRATL